MQFNTQDMQRAGTALTIAGAISSAAGSYYAARSAQTQQKAQASALAHNAAISEINRSVAEFQAQTILLAGQKKAGQSRMQYGQIRGASKASMAARGLSLGVGSSAEVIASIDLADEIDSLTINANAVSAAEEMRMQAVNLQNQASLQRVSAVNLNASANTISPFQSTVSSLLTSAPGVLNALRYTPKAG